MKIRILWLIFCSLILGNSISNAQGHNKSGDADSSTLLSSFKNGRFDGNFRYFFMATDNEKYLSDYYSNAIGGGLKYESSPFHNIQLGMGFFYTFNIASSDLLKTDSATKQSNRYEIGLFDIENPNNKSNISRVGELYLKYSINHSQFIFGRQMIQTPFVNLQDGRMRPTEVEGLWTEISELKKNKIEIGYLYRLSPRSTIKYYDIAKSIGIYPAGVNEDGTKSAYKNVLQSAGVFIAGITNQSVKNLKLQIWNQFVENIFNTSMLQAEYSAKTNKKSKVMIGVQSIYQTAVNNGGNAMVGKSYIAKGGRSFTYGAKIGLYCKRVEASINFNRITSLGRYLMPREWGKDPFYTFLPRERNEGLGDVKALTLKVNGEIPKTKLKVNIGAGYYDLPSVKNFKLNKYGMTSYAQLNVDLKYEFSNFLQGLDAQLLLVRKINTSNEILTNSNIINRVNMTNLNFVMNYRF